MSQSSDAPRTLSCRLSINSHPYTFEVVPASEMAQLEVIANELSKMLKRCAEQLEAVRTGEDFEVACWDVAEEARKKCKVLKAYYASASKDDGLGNSVSTVRLAGPTMQLNDLPKIADQIGGTDYPRAK